MLKSLDQLFKNACAQTCTRMRHCFFGVLVAALISGFFPTAHAQKKPAATQSAAKISEEEKKFDALKRHSETVWTCENNVILKTAYSDNNYLFLHNKKLYIMSGIEALNGVSRYSDGIHRVDWFIIPGKAMLFDSKIGQRLLDYCSHPELVAADTSKGPELLK